MPFTVASGVPLSRRDRIVAFVGGAACVVVLAVAARIDPDPRGFGTHEQLGLPPCPVSLLFNLPCPSCGATTSVAHFVRGHWRDSVRCHAGAFLLAVAMTLAVPWLWITALLGRAWLVRAPWLFASGIVCVIAVTGFVQWVLQLAAMRI